MQPDDQSRHGRITTDSPDTVRLRLPRNRIRPGAVVAVRTPGAGRRRFRLPAGVAPGSRIVLRPDDGSAEVTVIVTLLDRS